MELESEPSGGVDEGAGPEKKRRRLAPSDQKEPPVEAGDGATASEAAPPRDPDALRFKLGTEVVCNISKRARGFVWKAGKVIGRWQEVGSAEPVPYVVEFKDGALGAAPEDHDECIRLAARATLDLSVLKPFAVSLSDREAVPLRFMEGSRVAVQLDAGDWEEGTVTEVWAAPERNGRPIKGWAKLAMPYGVRLDLGEDVLVPFDSEQVILHEHAKRPSQKSIAELIGGKDKEKAAS